jgi:DNA-binding NtrC family response regulator
MEPEDGYTQQVGLPPHPTGEIRHSAEIAEDQGHHVDRRPMTSSRPRILVVDDEEAMREVLQMRLEQWGFDVRAAADGAEGRRLSDSFRPDIVISDVIMPGLSGLELLEVLKAGAPGRPVILITAQGSIDLAVEAMKSGASDFITKPLDYAKLKATIEAVLSDLGQQRESKKLEVRLEKGAGFGDFVGTGPAMREVYSLLSSIARSDASVIVTGESGTGKELAARTIHELSSRSAGPFIAVNAAAIPETLIESEVFGHEKGAFTGAAGVRAGCFELAHGGTLFLDEIAEMPLPLQPKLLRVIEDRKVRRLGGSQEFTVDARVIAATNREPWNAVQSGQIREDLYYRLNVFTVALPPLRDRREDIPLLALHFMRQFNQKHRMRVEGMRAEALEVMTSYSWPGNVRELRNILERAVILARDGWIERAHLPAYLNQTRSGPADGLALPTGATIAEVEKELILRTLEATGQNKAEAARRLGLDVKTIRNKLKTYNLS